MELKVRKARGDGSEGFRDLPSTQVLLVGRPYALVRVESTPLASAPMLLPKAV
jgi:hypothetical protein